MYHVIPLWDKSITSAKPFDTVLRRRIPPQRKCLTTATVSLLAFPIIYLLNLPTVVSDLHFFCCVLTLVCVDCGSPKDAEL